MSANTLRPRDLAKGTLGKGFAFQRTGTNYGHSTTFQCTSEEDPPDYLRRGGIPSYRRCELWALPLASRGTDRGPGDHLERRSEARTHAARGPRAGNSGSRGHPLDPGTNECPGRENRNAAWCRRGRQAGLGDSRIERSASPTGHVGRTIPTQGSGSRLRQPESPG